MFLINKKIKVKQISCNQKGAWQNVANKQFLHENQQQQKKELPALQKPLYNKTGSRKQKNPFTSFDIFLAWRGFILAKLQIK